MKFCRYCYATMADDEAVCHACETVVQQASVPRATTDQDQRVPAPLENPKGMAQTSPALIRPTRGHLQILRIQLQQVLSLNVHGVYFTDIGLILFLGIYFMWPEIIVHNSTFTGDNLTYYVFMNRLLNESILRLHQLPLWNPYYFSGMPYVANPQSASLYFSTLFILIFGESDGTRWAVILHVILSGVTMYYLLIVFKQRRLGALLSGVGYMFSGYMWARIAIGHILFVYAYAWTPLAFAFCVKAARTGRLQYAALAGTVLMLQLQSGGIIILGYTLILISSYLFASSLLWYLRNRRLPDSTNAGDKQHLSVPISRFGTVAFVILLVFFLLSSVKLFPVVEFLSQMPRIVERGGLAGGIPNVHGLYSSLFEKNTVYYNLHPETYGWWEYSAYVGWLIFPAMAAIFLTWPKRNREIFFLVIFGVSVMFGMGVSSPLSSLVIATYKYAPLFSALLHLPARFLFLAVFSVSVLSGTAISSLLHRIAAVKRKDLVRVTYFLVCCFLILVIFDMGVLATLNVNMITLPPFNGPYTSSAPNDLSIIWMRYPTSITAPTNQSFTFSVVARNVGDTLWIKDGRSEGSVNLVVLVGSAEYRYPLTNDVHPNDLVNLTVTVPGFPDGEYSLKINFVDELVGWKASPPYPALLAVSDLFSINHPRVLYETIPVESYSEMHALLWISKQNHEEYFRIGPYSWFEYDLYQL
ncbi:MAG TPA: hypothetical protein VK503_04785, partial [Candidatus Bathyarchaeia archaeon]|nr:hypothetical protein [Candidatus Bathyarchaeia archaeon]